MRKYVSFVEKESDKSSLKINFFFWKVRGHCYYTGKYRDTAHSIWHLQFNKPNQTPVVFDKVWNYGYHFNIKE